MNALIEKTQGIVTGLIPYSRTSQIVKWFTPTHGKITTIIKGARRPRSYFLGQYDLFYTCELLFYSRARTDLHIARECSPLNTRAVLRNDWRSCSLAAYVCELAMRSISEGANQPKIFELLTDMLNIVTERGSCPQCIFWYELRLLTLLGLAPQLKKCELCGRALPSTNDPAFFSAAGGTLSCASCPKPGSATVALNPSALGMMQNWQRSGTARVAYNTTTGRRELTQIASALDRFMEYHLGFKPPGRGFIMEQCGLKEARWQKLVKRNL